MLTKHCDSNEGVGANTVATERGILLRALGRYGDGVRLELNRRQKIRVEPSLVGKAFSADEQRRMLEAYAHDARRE